MNRSDCPFCKDWHIPTSHHSPTDTACALRHHLQTTHPTRNLHCISDDYFTQHNLHPCRRCNTPATLFLNDRVLKTHNTRTHSTTRTDTNATIITNALRHTTTETWSQNLLWLQNLPVKPPSFTTNIWRRLRPKTQQEYFATLHQVHQWILLASTPIDHPADHPAYQTSSEPLWKIALLLDTLILHPTTPTESQQPDTAVLHRLASFRHGHLRRLHTQAFSIPAPPQTSTPTFTDDDIPSSPAQALANEDNLRSAYQRVQSTLPIASMTPNVRQLCENLYPARIPPSNPPHHAQRSTRSTAASYPAFPLDEAKLHQALSSLKRGTAGGPVADLTDTLKSYALFAPTPQADEDPSPIYFSTFAKIIGLILSNAIPPVIARLLRSNRFIAFHKDPNDLTKLRPIGIGTAYRRIVGALITATFSADFATFLLPQGQMGIAVHGGIDFLIHSAQTQLDHYIQQPLANGQHPHRALLLLDIENMFNETSREAAKEVLLSKPQFRSLLPYFDLMYGEANHCYFRTPQGDQDFFLQNEGFPQGDPLASILSCLVLHRLLEQLNARAHTRAQLRLATKNPGDDGLGSQAATSSFIDDTFAYLTYEDLLPFILDFKELGAPLGIRLNRSKTQILTTTTTQPSHSLLSASQLHHLHLALAELEGPDSEITQGTRLLGAPLGSTDFVNRFLDKAAATFDQQTRRLINRIPDKQTAATLFKFCALPSLAHLLATDVLHNTDLTTPPSLSAWQSPFATKILATTHTFLQHLGDTPDELPALSLLLAHHPVRLGGSGFRDHTEAAITSFLIPLTRSIRMATTGVPIADSLIKLPTIYTRHFRSWATQRNPTLLIRTYRHLLPPLLDTYNLLNNTATLPSITSFATNAPLRGLQSKVYQHLQRNNIILAIDQAPDHFQAALPSLLSSTTSLALHSLSRRHPQARLPTNIYTLLTQRKLRLPVFPLARPPPLCRHCKKPCDHYGDHLFSCKYSKTPLHNTVRNTLHTILSTLAPIAGLIHSKFDTLMEPTNLLPQHPLRRPADIALRLKSPTAALATTLAIDVTITPVPAHLRSQPTPSQPSNLHEAHLRSIRSKLTGRTHSSVSNASIIQAINTADIALLPFTVDHLGGLGYFSHRLLFHEKDPPFPAPPPPNFLPTHFSHPHAYRAYSTLLKSTPGVLSQANYEWSQLRPHHPTRFGQTYHTSTPQQWALQCFSLNLSHGLASHLLRARASCLAASTSTTTPHTILGPTFRQSYHKPPLVPGPPRHLPTHSAA
jgi:hypothetical protein